MLEIIIITRCRIHIKTCIQCVPRIKMCIHFLNNHIHPASITIRQRNNPVKFQFRRGGHGGVILAFRHLYMDTVWKPLKIRPFNLKHLKNLAIFLIVSNDLQSNFTLLHIRYKTVYVLLTFNEYMINTEFQITMCTDLKQCLHPYL